MDHPTPRPCKKCPALVIDVRHHITHAATVVDAVPVDDGNIFVDGLIYEIVRKEDRIWYAGLLRKTHFITCPAANEFRRHKKDRR